MSNTVSRLEFTITVNGVNTVLTDSPIGWDGAIIKYLRSAKYFGLFKSATPVLKFVGSGAALLRSCFYTYGCEAEAYFKIRILNRQTLTYSDYYYGTFDFYTFKDNTSAFCVEIVIVEQGNWEKIKSKSANEFEIDIDTHPDVKTLNFQPLPLIESRTMEFSTPDLYLGWTYEGYFLNLSELANEVLLNDSFSQSGDILGYTAGVFPIEGRFFYFNPAIDLSRIDQIEFVVTIEGDAQSSYITDFDAQIILHGFSGLGYEIGVVNALHGHDTHFSFSKTFTFTSGSLPSRDWYVIARKLSGITGEEGNLRNMKGTIVVNYYGIPEPKQIKCLPAKSVFESLITNVNEGTLPLYQSDFLDSISDYMLTAGDAVRGLPGSKIKWSVDKYFDAFNKMYNLGLDFGKNNNGVESIVLEEKDYFFNDTELHDFGTVTDLTVELCSELFLSTLAIGYKSNEYENKVNGKYEFNLEQNWNFPNTKLNKAENKVCDLRADVYGWTFTSLNLENKKTTEGSSDNSIFIAHTKTSGAVTVLNQDYDVSSVVGFAFPDYLFNFKLTPKRLLLNWGNLFHSICDKLDSKYLNFGNCTQNSEFGVKADDEAALIKENENILVYVLPEKLCLPYYFSCKVIVPDDFNINIVTNKNGYVVVNFEGVEYKLYLYELSINQSQDSEFILKGICHKSNDLSKLIR